MTEMDELKQEAVERIYLIPDRDEGRLRYVWCDDPAPAYGMDQDEAVEYVRRDKYDALAEKLEAVRLEAKTHAQEARTQRSTVHEIYQLVTGASGEPGDWHGVKPIRELVAERFARGNHLDMVAHMHRQIAFSTRTFGPGERQQGVIDHIRKELREIEDAPNDLEEWIDVVLLALDGAWRSGHTAAEVVAGLDAKLSKNEQREWPDWRTSDRTKAIEHDRTKDRERAE
ncbi:Protein of unknown function [Onishia taeanensis]|uniref:dATP/dGTP diphosphohydrolase MazZ domain-containing protein n=1 Tax=Onishia taeanensis TaxID=284577 RepID=A0A1G7ND77_9GAMM|nr:dATP/dGTP pyrophosphohydrolase domain-containing protein [Halomonas taeanensis]SDF71912.1 Protein of unknown function [Halomonas taeanensis]